MSVLSEILAAKRTEVDCARRRVPVLELERRVAECEPTRDFLGALRAARGTALIAEVKKASPSKGVIREDFDPVEIARSYQEGGATCLSVLTDEPYFQGHLSHLSLVRQAVDLPLLRKDFTIDDYQLLESRAAGADAILLIAAALTKTELEWMLEGAHTLGMAAIVEVHDADELDEVLQSPAHIIGINNRDLHTFRTTLRTTLDLIPRVPKDRVVISESGVNHRSDVERLQDAGVHAILVGESLMREADVPAKVRELLGKA